MKAQNQAHLSEDQILWAVVDEMELAAEDRQHLRQCPACRMHVEQFQAELQYFGEQAGQAIPPSSRVLKLPVEKPAAVSHNAGWLPFFGAAAMAGFFVFFYFAGLHTMNPSGVTPRPSQESLLEDEYLMREIADMVEAPLTEEMYEITGENGIGFDDDFWEFVVPEIQDDFQSEIFIQGGIMQC